MTLLLPTGRADGQDPLDKVVSIGTVRAETALPPEHSRTERLFSRIVGRLDPVLAHKRPQRGFVVEQLLTHPIRRGPTPRPVYQEDVERCLNRGHHRLERGAINRSVPEAVPELKYHVREGEQIRAPHAKRPVAVGNGLEVALQVAPAELMARWGEGHVWSVSIRPNNAGIVRADHVAQSRPIATGQHRKDGGDGRDHGP